MNRAHRFLALLISGTLVLAISGCSGPSRSASGSSAKAGGLGKVTITPFGGIELLQQRSARERTVAVRIIFIGGSRLLSRSQEGLEALTLQCVAYGSSGDASAADIRQRLDDLGARVSVEPGADYSTISLHCLERHFVAAWGLLIGQIMSPALVEEEFEPIRAAYLDQLTRLERLPEVSAMRRAREALLYQHPYIGSPEGTAESVAALPVDSVQAHYARLLRPERIRIVTAGGLDPVSVQQQLIGTITALPRRPFELRAVPVLQFTDRPQMLPAAEAPGEAEAEPIAIAEVIGIVHAPSPGSRASLAFEVAWLAVRRRLEADLCRRRSLTCAIRVQHEPALQAYASLGLTTDKPAPTIRAVVAAFKALSLEGLTQNEVDAARAQLLTEAYGTLQDSDGRARRLAQAWMQGEGMPGARGDWRLAATAPSIWRALSTAEVNATLRTALAEVAWCYVGDTRAIGYGVFAPQ